MTTQQRRVIKQIALHMIEFPEEKGIKQKELLDRCIEECILMNQKEIKTQLNEAKDHKVVLERQDEHGFTVYMLPFPLNVLEKVIEEDLKE